MKTIGVSKSEALASGVIVENFGEEYKNFGGVDIIIPRCPMGYTPTNFHITDTQQAFQSMDGFVNCIKDKYVIT
jgi:hypothetical protein